MIDSRFADPTRRSKRTRAGENRASNYDGGAEPIGTDLNLLYIFYELGLRVIGLTHARSNAAGSGGVFAPTGSSPKGLTAFGCELVRECERVGVILDLAHINPAGFDDIWKTPPDR